MGWNVHKPANCLLGKQHKEDQKKKPQKAVANSTTFAAAAATAVNPHFAALMASIADLEHARKGVDVYNVSNHGWANNAYRTPSCLP